MWNVNVIGMAAPPLGWCDGTAQKSPIKALGFDWGRKKEGAKGSVCGAYANRRRELERVSSDEATPALAGSILLQKQTGFVNL